MTSCAFCKDDLNPGATVCCSCGRKQPDPERRRNIFALIVFLLIVGAVGVGIYLFIANANARQDAMAHAKMKSDFCGSKLTGKQVEEAVTRFHDQGESWADAASAETTLVCGR